MQHHQYLGSNERDVFLWCFVPQLKDRWRLKMVIMSTFVWGYTLLSRVAFEPYSVSTSGETTYLYLLFPQALVNTSHKVVFYWVFIPLSVKSNLSKSIKDLL